MEKKIEGFTPNIDIWQGNPLSPFIFILAMEYLTKLIQDKIQNNSWKPFKFWKNSPFISHLLFAGDILLFSTANNTSIQAIHEVISNFCELSGLKLYLQKTKAWFSKQVNP